MDERLNEINRELKELNEALARQGRMEAQWKDLQDQRAERDRRVMETGRVFRKEQDDVDRPASCIRGTREERRREPECRTGGKWYQ